MRLLLVRQVDKKWDVNGAGGAFEELVAAVRAFAEMFGLKHDRLIVAETINLWKVGTKAGG